ncbi:MAG: T9SS type A sorting domain-containing protein [Candidatus Krumholzibacteria bacterium]|nr:T9SS type A sorting domain-containing protein [Candidatus Krumholzibacteria bacterium]
MKKFTMFAALALAMVFALSSFAGDLPRITKGNSTNHGGNATLAKALGDTVDLMGPEGSGSTYIGDFTSGWNDWMSVDVTAPTVTHWEVSDYNQAVVGNMAAWCGDILIESCNDSLDVVGGYGADWNDLLVYRATVADPASSATVNVTATLQHDSEPGYDYTRLAVQFGSVLGYTNIQSWDGTGTVATNNSVTYLPSDLVDGTDVLVVWRFQSDGAASDGDCQGSAYGAGACQVDDVTVTTSQLGQADIVAFDDFQVDFGNWAPAFPVGVGDFAALWNGLEDGDPCRTNYSQQVAFIDDGTIVPGTGGADCINWCYGPSGYIVNTVGGLAGPIDGHIQTDIQSPVMIWPNATYDGIQFEFDAYRHEDLSADAPGIFYTWGIRSADTDGSAGDPQILANQAFRDRNFVYYGGPDYFRPESDVTDLMNPGRDEVQLRLGVWELGWQWGWVGNDGYPAPYFDNVSVKVFPYVGPGMSNREIDLAQDNFPEVDALNFLDLGSMHVRFDMANNSSLPAHLRNDPGDSMVVSIVPVRSGAALAGNPEFHYTINANPVFDAFRTTATSGMLLGVPGGDPGAPVPDLWAFDMPDTGTLFPGDVLHYYIRAGDAVGADVQYSTMPADISGFGDFSDPLAYNSTYTIHALPTIIDDGFGSFKTPGTIFWNDFADRGGEQEWYGALNNLGMKSGFDYDIFYTNGPSSGVGNGIGGRTSGLALENYTAMLYTSGDLGLNTISNGDFEVDPGDDIGALINWMSAGNKNIFFTGDDLASDLAINAGATGTVFHETVMGVNVTTNNIRSFIGNQTAPLVLVAAGNPVIQNLNSWIAYGGCLGINTFDGVTVRAGATRLAEFADTNDNPGAYEFSAATLNIYNTTNRIVSMPYDLMYLYTAPGGSGGLSDRAKVLSDVLDYFGVVGSELPSPVLPSKTFAASNYPNPFNPSTKISYTIKAAGHLKLKIYNVRGELVRTLIDGNVEASDFVMWDGTNNQGSNVSSGVYFYEARMGNDVVVNKMALVK